MRPVTRAVLPKTAASYLSKRQSAANGKRKQRKLNIESDWKSARQTKALKAALATLLAMMGPRQRCMYCLDSHGSDIDHFRPKAVYPQCMYEWSNLLLSCTECGRFKGNQFPTARRRALLIDPTAEDPWEHLDFDPATGNICARFNIQANGWSVKGATTVQVLQLDRREALSAGYLQTLRRLCDIVQTALSAGGVAAPVVIAQLKDVDDHGLLGWCFSDRGQTVQPFGDLRQQHPEVWRQCRRALEGRHGAP